MQASVTILWDQLHCAEGHLLSYDGEKIRWVFKFLCESSELLHTKYLGLLATEILSKCTLIAKAPKDLLLMLPELFKENKNKPFDGNGMNNIYQLFDGNSLSLGNNLLSSIKM